MGTLRTLFAISVVFAHSFGFVFVGGQNAVQLFYIISGFLISYILVEKKAYSTISSFYINRYLRIYPVYAAIAVLSFIYFSVSAREAMPNIFKIYEDVPISAAALLVFSNITLFLQDWVMFSGIQNNELVFATNFSKSDILLYQGLLVPQAWTLGVELTFYLIAPFVLVRKKLLLTLLLLSIVLRLYLIQIGLGTKDPWTYRFFPTELALFLLGALAHQILLPFYTKSLSAQHLESYAKVATHSLIFITLIYSLIPLQELFKAAALIILFLVLIPLTFVYQSKRGWDKWIGDLSYPIYISHILVIAVIRTLLMQLGTQDKYLITVSAIFFSIMLAIGLNILIANPIERLRSRFRAAPN